MPRKHQTEGAVNLDSFLDILTCLQGILMLVIIATGIDAAQTKVLIPTPMERVSARTPVYLECRGNKIYPLDSFELARKARAEVQRINQEAAGDPIRKMQLLGGLRVTDDFYEVDMSYYLVGQLVIKPRPDPARDGYELEERSTFATDNFMVNLLKNFPKENRRIVLIARDDSYSVFKVAQRLAFLAQVELGVEIYDRNENLRFTMQGLLISTS
ncbi:MAG: hypothetical protein NZ740_07550 [Kiritimatiellae bacterium]|nr:hypothetical protein [Kiritimatiellia bacterium]MDW8458950.1 hypothetical protein [Verrucomicrobiota bacterium]